MSKRDTISIFYHFYHPYLVAFLKQEYTVVFISINFLDSQYTRIHFFFYIMWDALHCMWQFCIPFHNAMIRFVSFNPSNCMQNCIFEIGWCHVADVKFSSINRFNTLSLDIFNEFQMKWTKNKKNNNEKRIGT